MGQHCLEYIVTTDWYAILPQIIAQLNAGAHTTINVQTVQHSLCSMGFWSQQPIWISLLALQYMALFLAWARKHYNWMLETCSLV